jgi:hypothetical protein
MVPEGVNGVDAATNRNLFVRVMSCPEAASLRAISSRVLTRIGYRRLLIRVYHQGACRYGGAQIVAEHRVLPCRVFLSYAHESAAHVAAMERFCRLLRSNGVDARMDLFVAEQRVDWVLWTIEEIRLAERVLVMVTSEYRERFERDGAADTGRGVQLEAGLIREEIYRDRRAGLDKFLPVLLPGSSIDDIPAMLQPRAARHFQIHDLTVAGAEQLLRLLTGQPSRTLPGLGEVPTFPVVSPELVVVLRMAVSGGTLAARGELFTAVLRVLSASDAQVQHAPDGEAEEAAVTVRSEITGRSADSSVHCGNAPTVRG